MACTPSPSPARLLTTKDLAARWQVHVGHLANLRSAGGGPPYVKLGGSVRYREEDVSAWELANLEACA